MGYAWLERVKVSDYSGVLSFGMEWKGRENGRRSIPYVEG